MSLLSRVFSGGQEARTISSTNWYQPDIPPPGLDGTFGNGLIPEGNPMGLAAFYACVTLLADIVSTLPLKAYREKSGTTTLIDPQPALLFRTPYPGLTWFSWLWMMMESLAVTGNAFGYVTQFDKAMLPTAIMPVHPDSIFVEIPEDPLKWADPTYYIAGKKVASYKVVHIKRYPIAGQPLGMSPVQKAAQSIGLGLAADRYGLRYFRESANPSGLLTTDAELSPEQQKRAMKSWIISHQGRRLPAVMSGGLKWQPVMLTPDESQFLETRSFQRTDIAMWFRIPPHMISDTEKSTSWGTGLEEQTLGFLKYTLAGWLTCFEQEITAKLPRGQIALFDTDELLRSDVKRRWEAYRLGRDTGVYSVNEIRDKENMAPIGPEGDIHLQPANFVPLGTPPSEMSGAADASPPDTSADSGDNQGE